MDEPDSMDWTPAQCLEDCIKVANEKDPDACVVLFLWKTKPDGSHAYDTRFSQSGLSCSEMIALFEVNKAKMLGLMGYIPTEEKDEE